MRPSGIVVTMAALAAAPVLERVEVSGRTAIVVRLTLSAPVAVRSQVPPPRLGQLDRILVDLEGATLGPVTRGVVGGRGALLRILPDQLDATTVRLTLELASPARFDVTSAGPVVTITLTDDEPVGATPPTIPSVERPAVPGAPRP
jgi:hypothetical protein